MKRFNINLSDRKMLYIILAIISVSVFSLTIIYAALSVTLNIIGSAQVVDSSWDIKLAHPSVKSGSATTDVPTISGDTLTFNTTLTTPGDYYEFTVGVVNNGSIDAMIDSVTKNPELTAEQAKYLKYEITYQNGEAITSKQLLEKKSTVSLKVRLEYRKDLIASDLPKNNLNLNLSLTLHYVQSDGNGTNVSNNGREPVQLVANGSLDAIGTIVTIGSEQFYTIGTQGNNVKLLSMYNLYVGNTVNSDWIDTPLSNPTGVQDSISKGYEKIDGVEKFPFFGTTVFSDATYHGEYYSEYSGSLAEKYVNEYKTILEIDYGVDIVEARLITKDELVSDDIGCNEEESSCEDAPRFIYATTYWTMTSKNNIDVWNVHTHSYFGGSAYNYDDIFGIRPVIVVPKSLF